MAPAFERWLDDFLDAYYRANPVSATFIGKHDHDDRLPEGAPDVSDLSEWRRRLDELPPEALTPTQSIDRDLARGFLEIHEWEMESRHLLRNPAWYTGEAIFGVFSLLLTDFAPLERRLTQIRNRLEAIPRFLAQARSSVCEAPRAWSERALDECAGALRFFEEGLGHVPHDGALDDAAAAASESFTEHHAYLSELPSVERVAAGEPSFATLLREAHALPWSPGELATLARTELERARNALETNADWRSELSKLSELHPTRERFYDSFTECWRRSRQFAEDNALLTWPDDPLDYVPQPMWARAAAPSLYFLFYRSPAPFDELSRTDYLVTPLEDTLSEPDALRILRATNDSVIKLNHVVHHGGLGHHVQNWHARRSESRIGRIAAVDGASRIAMLCGGTMAEGWACYATDLMDEAGFLTPLESFSQHHAHVRMAARAIVDVELHCEAMSFAQAEAFYVEQTAMPAAAARKEVTKNSMFPGAAVIYFAGTKLIHDLRAELARRHGSDFELRAFHDRFLSYGSIPVAKIRDAMLRAPEGS